MLPLSRPLVPKMIGTLMEILSSFGTMSMSARNATGHDLILLYCPW